MIDNPKSAILTFEKSSLIKILEGSKSE